MERSRPSAARATRARARPREGERLGDEALDAAERLLVDTGDQHAVSVRAVAGAVGCTPPALYLHFADRTELIWAVCERGFEAIDRFITEAVQGVDDPVEELRLRGRAYVEFGLAHPEQYRVLFMGHPLAVPRGFDPGQLLADGGFQGLVESVRRCIEAGVIRRPDPTLVALGLWAGVHGLTSLLISKPWFPWPELDVMVDHLLQVQLYGLSSPPPGGRSSAPRT